MHQSPSFEVVSCRLNNIATDGWLANLIRKRVPMIPTQRRRRCRLGVTLHPVPSQVALTSPNQNGALNEHCDRKSDA